MDALQFVGQFVDHLELAFVSRIAVYWRMRRLILLIFERWRGLGCKLNDVGLGIE
jgi:hypothetical protein